jgi:hypothetical protein
VIREEEVKLREMFPEDFDDYCARIPRFFPHHIAFEEPKSCTVNPRIYRRHIFSALWFILIVGWLNFIEDLHEANLLPVFFHVY